MKKLLSMTIIAIVVLAMSVVNVYAAGESVGIKITPNPTTVKAGETVTITFSTTNFKAITSANGLAGISGTISYDKTKFEELKFNANGSLSVIVEKSKF